MGDPVAVLVVPAAGDPGGLTASGVLGAHMPVVWRHVHKDGSPCWDPRCSRAWVVAGRERALPLWWDGALVPEGWDRYRRVLASLPRDERPTGPLWGWLHDFRVPVSDLVIAAEFGVRVGRGRRVVLLDRVEGRLVERVGVGDAG